MRVVDALVSRGTVYERDVWMGSGTENKRHNKYCIIISYNQSTVACTKASCVQCQQYDIYFKAQSTQSVNLSTYLMGYTKYYSNTFVLMEQYCPYLKGETKYYSNTFVLMEQYCPLRQLNDELF